MGEFMMTLTEAQKHLALILVVRREELRKQVERELQGLAAAQDELVRLIRLDAGLPEGEYKLEQQGDSIILIEAIKSAR